MNRFRLRSTPFDIAPRAQRYTPAAWRIFGAGLLFLSVCTALLVYALVELRSARTAQTTLRADRQAFADAQRMTQARLSDPAVLEKIRTQQRLQQIIRMSWFGLFDALEEAARQVRDGVSLLSLAPSAAQGDTTQVRLTAVAVNAPIMLEYLRILRQDPRILSTELNSQQPDENVGPGVIRMQFTVLWNPQIPSDTQIQNLLSPSNRATDRGLILNTPTGRAPVAKVVLGREAP